MQKKPNWVAILGLSLAGLCGLVCLAIFALIQLGPSIYQHSLDQSSLKVGSTAPDFRLTALVGGTVELSQFRGKSVLLTLGAAWCPDCRVEAPLLEALHRRHPELVLILVDSQESPSVVQNFVDEFGITHTVLLDPDGSVAKSFQIFAIPTELFIDGNGVIRAKIIETVTPQLLAEKLPLIGIQP